MKRRTTTKSDERPAAAYRRVTQRELDRRIRSMILDLGSKEAPAPSQEPRWITAADLVERLKPFLVYN